MATAKRTSGGRTTPPKDRGQGAPTAATTSASAWKKSAGVEGTFVTVPSGNVVKMKSPGMKVFLQSGKIPNALIPFVQEMMKKGPKVQDKPEAEIDDEMVASLLTDPEKLAAIFDLADQVTLDCVIEPVILDVPRTDDGAIIPQHDERRDPNAIYIDDLDFQDKMFIFNVAVGGPANLEKFREGPGAPLDRLSRG